MIAKKPRNIVYAVLLVFLFIAPLVINSRYQQHLFVLAGIYVLLASSLNLLTGYVGLLSLCHSAFFGIGAYTAAILNTRLGVPFILTFFASGIVAAGVGYFFGLISLRVRGSAFIIMSVSFLHIMHLLALNMVNFTQGQMGIGNITRASIFGYTFASRESYYYLVLVVCIVAVYLIYRLVNSRVGRAWVTIRENEELAKSVGVDVFKFANLAFVFGTFGAGVAGSLYAHYITFVSPDLFLFAMNTQILVMLIMGGKGTVVGPIVGGIVFSMLPEFLRVADEWRMPIFGAILVVGIIFLPNGVIKLPQQIKSLKAKKVREGEVQ